MVDKHDATIINGLTGTSWTRYDVITKAFMWCQTRLEYTNFHINRLNTKQRQKARDGDRERRNTDA